MKFWPRVPSVLQADYMINTQLRGTWPMHRLSDGRWVPSRPETFNRMGRRFYAAWLVLIGRADAVQWTEQ